MRPIRPIGRAWPSKSWSLNRLSYIIQKQPGATRFAIVLAVLFYLVLPVRAQEGVFADRVFSKSIRSVEFFNSAKEQSLPLMTLNSSETLSLRFDDLSQEPHSYAYTFEHCDMNWKSSGLSPIDYLDGFTEDRINDYTVSLNTLQGYMHYSLTLPGQNMKPKIDGNYVLKIYEEGYPEKIILTRRFYVLNPLVTLKPEVVTSTQIANRKSHQKINITVEHPQLAIPNPYTDVKLVLRQNGRPDTEQTLERPNQIRSGQLVYNDPRSLEFSGLNEFRKFDFRTLRLQSERVGQIYKDSVNTVQLLADQPYAASNYSHSFDENGNFFIRNQDGREPATDADYAYVTFTLETPRPQGTGDVYIVGKFNDYRLNEENKMIYDASRSRFYGSVYLKQGLYDYQYIWADKNNPEKINHTLFEGSFFETKNKYQVFFYYRRPGSRWDQLLGFQEFNN